MDSCIESNEIIDMLTAYNRDPNNEAVNLFFEKDNIWRILDVERYEPSHSAFLSWFFSQKSIQYAHVKYLLNLLILKAKKQILTDNWNKTSDMHAFSQSIITESYTIKSMYVVPEQLVSKVSRLRYNDRLDIFMRCTLSMSDNNGEEQDKILEIVIENKVDSKEGKDKSTAPVLPTNEELEYKTLKQTERYYYACSKENNNRIKDDVDYQLFVYLTPDRQVAESKNYILITYQDLVDYVFESFIKRSDIDLNTKSLIEAYLHNLGNPYNKNNRGIMAMTEEERELLVAFYNRNKLLFETTIEAMIRQADNDGDSDAKAEFEKIASGLKTAGVSRYYTINGTGKYKMHQVIGEYILFKLKEGKTFTEIHDAISKNAMFVSDDPNGVSVNKKQGQSPHSVEYNGTKYYITTQLRNGKPSDNFSVFMKKVNSKEPDFQISQY